MWHLKTRLGTFWVMESEDPKSSDKFLLGIDDDELAEFSSADDAAEHVYAQETGFYKWDCLAKHKAPPSLAQWETGAPEDW